MAVLAGEFMKVMETLAPPFLAWEKDAIGLQMGSPEQVIERALISLEMNEAVLEEAIRVRAQMILLHHTPLFYPAGDLREDQMPGRLLAEMIRRHMCLYCAHTNLDMAAGGVNEALADRLGLEDIRVLDVTHRQRLMKLVVYVPPDHLERVREAMAGAGAGWIGNYSDCAFMAEGEGYFRPGAGTQPYIGQTGQLERVREARIETVVYENQMPQVVSAMLAAHPYEETAYDLYALANQGKIMAGGGRLGSLPAAVSLKDLAAWTAKRLSVRGLRYAGDPEALVRRVAVCGGSGAFLIPEAKRYGAQVFITADIKHHEAQNALDLGLFLIDAGHFSTEHPVIGLTAAYLRQALPALQVIESQINTDPFWYLKE
jgi:dinuclear metal center YbgI/SA1388 family protein